MHHRWKIDLGRISALEDGGEALQALGLALRADLGDLPDLFEEVGEDVLRCDADVFRRVGEVFPVRFR